MGGTGAYLDNFTVMESCCLLLGPLSRFPFHVRRWSIVHVFSIIRWTTEDEVSTEDPVPGHSFPGCPHDRTNPVCLLMFLHRKPVKTYSLFAFPLASTIWSVNNTAAVWNCLNFLCKDEHIAHLAKWALNFLPYHCDYALVCMMYVYINKVVYIVS